MLRHLRNVRLLSSTSDDDTVFGFLAQHAEHLTGLRCIDWYFSDSDCEPLRRLVAVRGHQLEECVINLCSTSGFFDRMDPKVLKSLEFSVGDIPESVLQKKFPKLEHVCINTSENDYAVDFVASLDSLHSFSIFTPMDLDQIDEDILAESIRRIAASNRMLRRFNIDIYHKWQYDVFKTLLLGRNSSEDLVPNQLEDAVKSRFGISPEVACICGLNIWAIFNLRAPPEPFKKATDLVSWRHWLDVCHETVSDKLVALGRFMLRLCEPEVFEDKTLVDIYIAPIENALDDLLASESRYDPQLKTSSIACALLHWGGLLLLRSPEDPEIKKRVVERCSSTLQHTPNLLEVCSDAYSYELDMNWITSPAVHLVMELAEWYDPTTLVLKEDFSRVSAGRQVLLGMAVHPKFNSDVKIADGSPLCCAMLQSLLDTFVPDDSSYDPAYLALAKMCVDKNLNIRITSSLSAYSLQRMFASDEILELFSRLADDIGRLCDGEIIGHSAFGRSEKLFRGISFMLKKIEERGECSAEQVAEYRRSVSRPIWAAFQKNPYSFVVYDLTPTALEYVFEICSDLPECVTDYLEKGNSYDLARMRLLENLNRDERLRKYLPAGEAPKQSATPPEPGEATDDDPFGLFA